MRAGEVPHNRRVFRTALPGLVLGLQATCAFASGREGEALVQPILWIVVAALVTFAALVFGGGLLGAFRASQRGESILKGVGRGLLKGFLAFLVVGAVAFVGANIVAALWIAYSYLAGSGLKPS